MVNKNLDVVNVSLNNFNTYMLLVTTVSKCNNDLKLAYLMLMYLAVRRTFASLNEMLAYMFI